MEGTYRYTVVMDNRSTIAEQALDLFAERGYDAVGVQDIALASGVTKPTLYHYFGSKRGLLDALLQEYCGRLNAAVSQAAEYNGDLTNSLLRVTEAMFEFARVNPRFYRIYLSMWFALPSNEAHNAVAPYHNTLQRNLEQLFTAASKDHGNMRGRQRSYAATFLGTIHTYIGLALNERVELDETLVQQVVQRFSHGIYS